ncbi:hypothetical protein [Aquitalea sp.]|uniref:hypothetical protein n=1 Tax=Aquitalea sp. TaxID=1872623 RepID=UPI0025882671|nr:hypothetical protein [Aquitalea sp.]
MPETPTITSNSGDIDPLVAKFTQQAGAESALNAVDATAFFAQPHQTGPDLSQDIGSNTQSVQDTIAFQESADRRAMQRSLFNSAISLSVLMFSFAAVLAAVIVSKATDANKFDWHLPLLAAAFVVPPTLILIAIIRAIYPSLAKSDDKDNLPALNLVKEIAVAIKEAAKAVKG